MFYLKLGVGAGNQRGFTPTSDEADGVLLPNHREDLLRRFVALRRIHVGVEL